MLDKERAAVAGTTRDVWRRFAGIAVRKSDILRLLLLDFDIKLVRRYGSNVCREVKEHKNIKLTLTLTRKVQDASLLMTS